MGILHNFLLTVQFRVKVYVPSESARLPGRGLFNLGLIYALSSQHVMIYHGTAPNI